MTYARYLRPGQRFLYRGRIHVALSRSNKGTIAAYRLWSMDGSVETYVVISQNRGVRV